MRLKVNTSHPYAGADEHTLPLRGEQEEASQLSPHNKNIWDQSLDLFRFETWCDTNGFLTFAAAVEFLLCERDQVLCE